MFAPAGDASATVVSGVDASALVKLTLNVPRWTELLVGAVMAVGAVTVSSTRLMSELVAVLPAASVASSRRV